MVTAVADCQPRLVRLAAVIPLCTLDPFQASLDDRAGQALGQIDTDEQGRYAALDRPLMCLGREHIVDPYRPAAPDLADNGRQLVNWRERDRRKRITGRPGS